LKNRLCRRKKRRGSGGSMRNTEDETRELRTARIYRTKLRKRKEEVGN
jgi:hypothetical protein